MTSPTRFPSIILVGDRSPLFGALADTLQQGGEIALAVHNAPTARLVLAAAPSINLVMCRCRQEGEANDLSMLEELGILYPHIALVGLCDRTGHDHTREPPNCHFLAPSYDLSDVRRTLAAARLDAYERRHTS
jgi:antitoxin (DNA-binding transcriptional repressor) of toxin-antitoxin stability system